MAIDNTIEYVRNVKLDINPSAAPPVIRVKQGDASTRYIAATLTKDGEICPPDKGITYLFRCEKPDGKAVLTDSATVSSEYGRKLITISGNTVVIELISQVCVVAGRCRCDLCLMSGELILSTIPFIIEVVKSPDVGNQAVSSNEFEIMMTGIADSREATARATAAAIAAEEKAALADEKADVAEQAARLANQATTSATSATSQANLATSAANTAANDANAAKGNANTAAAKADESATKANDATSKAWEAIDQVGRDSEALEGTMAKIDNMTATAHWESGAAQPSVTVTETQATGGYNLDFGLPTADNIVSVNDKVGAVVLDSEDVGAVAKAGDTMTGDLVISRASDGDETTGLVLEHTDSGTTHRASVYADGNNLVVTPENNMTLNGGLVVSGGGSVSGGMNVTGNERVDGNMTVTGTSKVGGMLTANGDITIEHADSATLNMKTTNGNSTSFIRAYADSANSAYGNNMLIQANGNMIISSGESASAVYSNNIDSAAGNTETTFIVSDGAVIFYSNANTIEDRYRWMFNKDGATIIPGDTYLNGALTLGTVPAKEAYSGRIRFRDSASAVGAQIGECYDSSDCVGLLIEGVRKVGTDSYYNSLRLLLDNEGNAVVKIAGTGVAASWRSAIGAVNKAGDTMTGALVITNNKGLALWDTSMEVGVINKNSSGVEADHWGTAFYLKDKKGKNVGFIRHMNTKAGVVGIDIEATRNVPIDGKNTDVYNYFRLGIDSAGTRSVTISDAAIWRKALGLGSSGSLPITLAQGGTGATTRLAAFKNLANENVGADATHLITIKSDWSKCGFSTLQQVRNKMGLGNTTGALPIANGGTGQTAIEKITDIASVITVDSTNATITAANYVRFGKVAQIWIGWKNKTEFTVPANGNIGDIQVGTLVSGKRPAIYTQGHIHSYTATYSITTGGVISLTSLEGAGASRTIAANTQFYVGATFILP